jgi:formamidopyrimidine-DNA glycosylase
MPEFPEIYLRTQEIKANLVGRVIRDIDVLQPKSLNIPVDDFTAALSGAVILDAYQRGKWIFVETSQGYLLLNLGMGGEILLTSRAALPEKHRLVFYLDGQSDKLEPGADDQPCLSVNFWWFGYAHYAACGELEKHEMSAKLGPNATEVSLEELKSMLAGNKSRLKNFLLDQTRLAGIGNAYIHDILFLAGLHPLRKIDTLSQQEIEALHAAIRKGLQISLDKGGAFYEVNLFGEKGGFAMEDILIGYREGQPCPTCAAPIQKIKTGGTSSFICPTCQPLV